MGSAEEELQEVTPRAGTKPRREEEKNKKAEKETKERKGRTKKKTEHNMFEELAGVGVEDADEEGDAAATGTFGP